MALLQGADAAAIKATTALVRLLAATLGRDEPAYVLDAVRSVGLGPNTHPTHRRELADALTHWDMHHRGGAGELARRASLLPPTYILSTNQANVDYSEAIARAWSDAVAGFDLGNSRLDHAFSIETPPPAVVEALRLIYLWWGVDPERVAMRATGATPSVSTVPRSRGWPPKDVPEPPEPEPHFLDKLPLDYSDERTRLLERILTGAYPTAADLHVLTARTGINVGLLNMSLPPVHVTRDLLELACREGLLRVLIQQVLADPATASFHDEIRALVGPELG